MTAIPAGTSRCDHCDEPVRLVPVTGGRLAALDPTSRVYVRESDGEGGSTWTTDPHILAQHRCARTTR